MRTAPESRKISAILKSLRDESLEPTPEFQRRSVWTNKDKIAFIETILMGYPFPEIYIASGEVDTQTGDANELLVDGQQRLRTIHEYFRGVSPFSRTQAITRYSNLSEDEKRDFLNYDVSVRNLGILDEEQIRIVFQRMNATSYDLNDMERYNAVYLGEFKKFCEEIAQEDFFLSHRIFSPADIRRMRDISFVASLSATMLSDYFHRDDEIENYLERYNDVFDKAENLKVRFNFTLNAIGKMGFGKESRAWRKADFYTLFIEVDRVNYREEIGIDLVNTGARISSFYAEVNDIRDTSDIPANNVAEYFKATLQSTNDKSVRIARGKIIHDIIVQA